MLRLTALACILFIGAAQEHADKVQSLIENLGSDDIDVREEAAKELKRIGFSALPALRGAAAKSTGDQKKLLDRIIDHVLTFGAPALVSMQATDRPLREIVADLERQTLIPFRLMGAAADVKVNVSAKETVIWKVVEDICRARGDLMYRFVQDTLEIYPSKFRALPSVDQGQIRFFVDRFIWEGGCLDPPLIRMHGGVLVPRGALLMWLEVKVKELTDDTGINVAHLPESGGYWMPDGEPRLPGSRIFAFPVAFHPAVQGGPAATAMRIARFRGTVELLFGVDERVLASVKDPLGRPSTPASGPTSLGITRWSVSEYGHTVQLSAAWTGELTKAAGDRCRPIPVMRLRNGDTIPPLHWNHGWSPGDNVDRFEIPVWYVLPKDAAVDSLDMVFPASTIKMEIPFEFKDIPLR